MTINFTGNITKSGIETKIIVTIQDNAMKGLEQEKTGITNIEEKNSAIQN
jgi:hypothetical protein